MSEIESINDQNIPKEKPIIDPLDVYYLARRCRVSHKSESDFRGACSCAECNRKITELMRFEKEIYSKMNIIGRHSGEVEVKKITCSWINFSVDWTIWLLHFLHKRLGQLYEESGDPQIPEDSRSTIGGCQKIMETMIENGFCRKPDEHFSFQEICEILDKYDLFHEIDNGKFYYDKTKVKDSPHVEIFKEIERLEQENKTIPDPTSNLQKQVELVRKLPVKQLQLQLEDTISEICPLAAHGDYYKKARKYIDDTLDSMITEGADFWQHYQECPSPQEHSSNQLDQTLDSLILKVKLFENEWEMKYAPFYRHPYYRSDPKKQRIKE